MKNADKRRIILVLAPLFILAGLSLPPMGLFIAAPITLLSIRIIDAGAIGQLGGRRFWAVIIVGALILPFLLGSRDIHLWGVGYSSEMLILMLRIALRGLLIFSGMTLIRRHVPPAAMAQALQKLRCKKLAILIPVSLHLVPSLMESSRATYETWRHRGGWKRRRVRNLRLLLTSLQFAWAREAEDLTLALALEEMERKSN